MKHKIFFYALLIVLFCSQVQSYAGDLANDTVWTKKTDEMQGFSSVQFIKNDEIIVAQSGYTIFYDAIDGKELYRLLGENNAIFFDNDKKFLRVENDLKTIKIYNSSNYEVLYELNNEDIIIQEFPNYVITKDEKYLIIPIINGIRIWDIENKTIKNTKLFEGENLTSTAIRRIVSLDETNNLLMYITKEYRTSSNPKPVIHSRIIEYNLETLDSISNWGFKGQVFQNSPEGTYIGFGIGGVQIYNNANRELISTIPINSLSLTGMEFSNDEKFIITSSTVSDNLLAIWSVETGKQLYEYTRASTSAFALSKNDKFIIKESGRLLIKYKITDQMLSVEEQNQNTIIYPNPTNGNLEIKYNINRPDVFQYEITNINGQVLLLNHLGFKNIGQNTDVIQVETLARGNYNLRLFSAQDNINFRFIKE